ncbi:MAG: hypothetical protein HY318_12230 [Armatimonadetes bacterium]|nr:hypothetical protein [Armatimonadota bacterium]
MASLRALVQTCYRYWGIMDIENIPPEKYPQHIPAAETREGKFRAPRALLLGLLLIPPNAYWVQYSELVREGGQPTMASLYFTSVFTLLIVTLANALLKKWKPHWAFSRAELLTVYVMVSVASSLAGHDQIEVLVPVMSHGFHYASPENKWEAHLLPHIPRHLIVTDKGVLRGFWESGSDLYSVNTLLTWMRPALWWIGFILMMGVTMTSLNLILRPRWTENEKLSYPLLAVPEQVVELKFVRVPLFWWGFGIAACIDLLNGFHVLNPAVPCLATTAHELLPVRDSRILSAFGYMPIAFYPFAIGLGFMLPSDFLLSCWVFFWVWKIENILGALLGWQALPRFPYVQQQSFGAYLGIAIFATWMARRYLVEVVRKAFHGGAGGDSTVQGAVFGALFGLAGLITFAVHGGMSVLVAIAYFTLFLGLSVGVTRMRGEMGVPAHDLHSSGPDQMLVTSLGSRALGQGNLTMFSMFWWMTRAYRSHPMPHELEGLEIGSREKLSQWVVLSAILLAVFAGAVSGLWSMLHIGYNHGFGHLQSDGPYFGQEAYSRLDSWLSSPSPADPFAPIAMAFGAGVTLFLLTLRTRFLWWPFHPIGYAVSSSLSMHILWMPMFIAWVAKTAVLRYRGIDSYRRAIPFCMGLILGEFVVGSMWSITGMILDRTTYRFWSY